MVEGPGCKLKGEQLKKRVCGQTLISIEVISESSATTSLKTKPYHEVSSFPIEDVKTLGKELFIFFAGIDPCLRIHFLMNGSVRYNGRADKKLSDTVIILHLSADTVYIFESCVDVRSARDCHLRYNMLQTVDICSPQFDFNQAKELINQHSDKMVCDVIMDQDVLPGVGNIIKNEALFNSGINPTHFVNQLNAQHITCLLHRLRDFSAVFYKCRKENSTLSRHFKIYGKKMCKACMGRVTICKPGELKRVTYYCSICQQSIFKLPTKGSILGFLQPKHDESAMWSCNTCTFLNSSTASSCSICLTYKHREMTVKEGSMKVETTPLQPICSNTTENVGLKRKSTSNGVIKQNLTKVVKIEQFPVPLCKGHGLNCVSKKTMKPGENCGRPFYVCPLPRAKQCNFFKWGDEHHPKCHHARVTVVRTVIKQNENNGKEFYSCPLAKNAQCDFFQWLVTK